MLITAIFYQSHEILCQYLYNYIKEIFYIMQKLAKAWALANKIVYLVQIHPIARWSYLEMIKIFREEFLTVPYNSREIIVTFDDPC